MNSKPRTWPSLAVGRTYSRDGKTYLITSSTWVGNEVRYRAKAVSHPAPVFPLPASVIVATCAADAFELHERLGPPDTLKSKPPIDQLKRGDCFSFGGETYRAETVVESQHGGYDLIASRVNPALLKGGAPLPRLPNYLTFTGPSAVVGQYRFGRKQTPDAALTDQLKARVDRHGEKHGWCVQCGPLGLLASDHAGDALQVLKARVTALEHQLAALKPPLKLEVGKVYVCDAGKVWRIDDLETSLDWLGKPRRDYVVRSQGRVGCVYATESGDMGQYGKLVREVTP